MNEQIASTYIHESPSRVRAILRQPLAFPDWNPAFLAIQGPAEAIVGQVYAIRARPGLAGTFQYTQLDDDLIGISWQVPGLHETGSWRLRAEGAGTLVTHEFSHEGALARALRGAFRGVAELRVDRLAQRSRSGSLAA